MKLEEWQKQNNISNTELENVLISMSPLLPILIKEGENFHQNWPSKSKRLQAAR